MAQFYHHTYINAEPHSIWNTIHTYVQQDDTVVAAKAPDWLVAQTGNMFYVYCLRPDTFMPTKIEVRLLITRDAAAAELAQADNIAQAIGLLKGEDNPLWAEFAEENLKCIKEIVTPKQDYLYCDSKNSDMDRSFWMWIIELLLSILFCWMSIRFNRASVP
jgi:hypothetical protein